MYVCIYLWIIYFQIIYSSWHNLAESAAGNFASQSFYMIFLKKYLNLINPVKSTVTFALFRI